MSTDGWETEITADEVVVSVCLNRQLFRRYEEAKAAAEQAQEPGMLEQPDSVTELLQAVVEAKAAVEEASKTFVFETVDYDRWQELLDEHPPTDEQRAENKYLEYNPLTFPAAAVKISCREPELSDDQLAMLQQKLPRHEWQRLWDAAWVANVGGSSIPKSEAAIVSRLASELNSITRLATASPSPSSEDEQ